MDLTVFKKLITVFDDALERSGAEGGEKAKEKTGEGATKEQARSR